MPDRPLQDIPEDDAPPEVDEAPEVAEAAPPQPPDPAADAPADDLDIDDAQTDKAIDEIVREESDELLAAEDTVAGKFKPTKTKHGPAFWWRHKVVRWLVILLLLGGVAATGIVPEARYWVLNTAGVRVSASVKVTDNTTGLALKDIEVTIGPEKTRTDAGGIAKLTHLTLGPHALKVKKAGFAEVHKAVTLGLGSNPLGEFPLDAVGVQYVLTVTDFITGKPVQGATATNGEAAALTDTAGKAILTLPGSESNAIVVSVSRSGYRTAEVTIPALSTTATAVTLVTDQKAVFVNKENGTYNVYSSDVDGQNKKLLLAGTGNEGPNISLVVSPDGSRAALVSTRDNQRDVDGFLLSTLTLITIADGSTVTLAHAEQIQLVDWNGSRLVFEQVSSDIKTPVNSRYSIISYDYTGNTRLQLAASSHFNTVFSAQGTVFYAIAADEGDTGVIPAFYKVNSDGTGKQKILDKEVWSAYRTDYSTLSLQTPEGWYAYTVTSTALSPISTPASYISRGYADNATLKQSVWVDNQGGTGVLFRYDRSTGKDTAVQTQAGMAYPVRWLTNQAAIFRVVSGGEIADYVASTLDGQPPRKISAVVNTYGFSQGN